MAITVAMRTQVSQLYVSLFGRAPDGEGLGFWVGRLEAGQTMQQVAQAMFSVDAARAYYPAFATNEEIVAKFYQYVLGRPVGTDLQGQAFWVNKLNQPGVTKGDVITELLYTVVNYTGTDPAGVASKALFNNKVAVAQYYGEQNGSIAGATDALNGVTSDVATVAVAEAAIDAGANGQTFTLTTGLDDFANAHKGTEGKDTYLGTVTSTYGTTGSPTTFNPGDSIDGAGGVDTLRLFMDQGAVADGVAVSNIQNLDLRLNASTTGAQSTLVMTDWDASLQKIDVRSNKSNLAVIEQKTLADISIVDNGTGNTASSYSFNYAAGVADGTADRLNISLDNVNGAGGAGLTTDAKIEALNLTVADRAGTVASPNLYSSNVNLTSQGVKQINVDGGRAGQAMTLAASVATGASLTATSFAGDMTLSSANIKTAAMGAGSDTLSITGQADLAGSSYSLGEGNNTLTVGTGLAGAVSAGSGNDAVTISGATTAAAVVNVGNGTNTVTVTGANAGAIAAGTGADSITVASMATTGSIAAGDGNNTVTVTGANAGTVLTGSGNDTIQAASNTASAVASLDLRGATLVAGNTVTLTIAYTLAQGVKTVQRDFTLVGADATAIRAQLVTDINTQYSGLFVASQPGTPNGVITLTSGVRLPALQVSSTVGLTSITSQSAGAIDAGAGNDLVKVTGAHSGVINLGAGDNTAIVGSTTVGSSISGGDNTNVVVVGTLVDNGTTTTVTGAALVGDIITGAGNDKIVVGATDARSTINAGNGNNRIYVASSVVLNDATDTVTSSTGVAHAGRIIAGSGNDTVGVGSITAGGSVDVGDGTNTVTVTSGVTDGRILVGNGNANTVTIGGTVTATTPGTVSFGNGNANTLTIGGNLDHDNVVFGSGSGNTFTVSGDVKNSGSITLGNGGDTGTVVGKVISGSSITMGSGADVLTLGNGGTASTEISGTNVQTAVRLGGDNDQATLIAGSTGDSTLVKSGGLLDGGVGSNDQLTVRAVDSAAVVARNAAQQVTINLARTDGGNYAIGDVVTIRIAGADYSYTVRAADVIQGDGTATSNNVATGVASAINSAALADERLNSVITLTGTVGNADVVVSASVNHAGAVTAVTPTVVQLANAQVAGFETLNLVATNPTDVNNNTTRDVADNDNERQSADISADFALISDVQNINLTSQVEKITGPAQTIASPLAASGYQVTSYTAGVGATTGTVTTLQKNAAGDPNAYTLTNLQGTEAIRVEANEITATANRQVDSITINSTADTYKVGDKVTATIGNHAVSITITEQELSLGSASGVDANIIATKLAAAISAANLGLQAFVGNGLNGNVVYTQGAAGVDFGSVSAAHTRAGAFEVASNTNGFDLDSGTIGGTKTVNYAIGGTGILDTSTAATYQVGDVFTFTFGGEEVTYVISAADLTANCDRVDLDTLAANIAATLRASGIEGTDTAKEYFGGVITGLSDYSWTQTRAVDASQGATTTTANLSQDAATDDATADVTLVASRAAGATDSVMELSLNGRGAFDLSVTSNTTSNGYTGLTLNVADGFNHTVDLNGAHAGTTVGTIVGNFSSAVNVTGGQVGQNIVLNDVLAPNVDAHTSAANITIDQLSVRDTTAHFDGEAITVATGAGNDHLTTLAQSAMADGNSVAQGAGRNTLTLGWGEGIVLTDPDLNPDMPNEYETPRYQVSANYDASSDTIASIEEFLAGGSGKTVPTVAVGSRVQGTLNVVGGAEDQPGASTSQSRDAFAVTLQAGTTYQLSFFSGESSEIRDGLDLEFRAYTSAGEQIISGLYADGIDAQDVYDADNFGSGSNFEKAALGESRIFTPTQSGTYYFEVGGRMGSAGTYSFEVAEIALPGSDIDLSRINYSGNLTTLELLNDINFLRAETLVMPGSNANVEELNLSDVSANDLVIRGAAQNFKITSGDFDLNPDDMYTLTVQDSAGHSIEGDLTINTEGQGADAKFIVGNTTLNALTVNAGGDVDVNITGNDSGANFEIGSVNLSSYSSGENSDLHMHIADNTDTTVAINSIELNAQDAAAPYLIVSDNTDTVVETGDVTLTADVVDGLNDSHDFGFDLENNLRTTVNMGAVALSSGYANGTVSVSANELSAVTFESLDINTEDYAEAFVSNNVDSDIAVSGNVTLTGENHTHLEIDGNAGTNVSLAADGVVSLTTCESDADVTVSNNLNDYDPFADGPDLGAQTVKTFNVTLGNVVLDAGADAYVEVSNNNDDTYFGDLAVNVGDVNVVAYDQAGLDINDNLSATVSVGDVNILSQSDSYVDINSNVGHLYTTSWGNHVREEIDFATISLGDVVVESTDSYAWMWVEYNDNAQVSAQDVTLTASNYADFYVYDNDANTGEALSQVTVDVDSVTLDAGTSSDFWIEYNDADAYDNSNTDVATVDVTIGNVDMTADEYAYFGIYDNNVDAYEGDSAEVNITVADLTVRGIDGVAFSIEDNYTYADGNNLGSNAALNIAMGNVVILSSDSTDFEIEGTDVTAYDGGEASANVAIESVSIHSEAYTYVYIYDADVVTYGENAQASLSVDVGTMEVNSTNGGIDLGIENNYANAGDNYSDYNNSSTVDINVGAVNLNLISGEDGGNWNNNGDVYFSVYNNDAGVYAEDSDWNDATVNINVESVSLTSDFSSTNLRINENDSLVVNEWGGQNDNTTVVDITMGDVAMDSYQDANFEIDNNDAAVDQFDWENWNNSASVSIAVGAVTMNTNSDIDFGITNNDALIGSDNYENSASMVISMDEINLDAADYVNFVIDNNTAEWWDVTNSATATVSTGDVTIHAGNDVYYFVDGTGSTETSQGDIVITAGTDANNWWVWEEYSNVFFNFVDVEGTQNISLTAIPGYEAGTGNIYGYLEDAYDLQNLTLTGTNAELYMFGDIGTHNSSDVFTLDLTAMTGHFTEAAAYYDPMGDSYDPMYNGDSQDNGVYVQNWNADFGNNDVVVKIGSSDLIYNAQHSEFAGEDFYSGDYEDFQYYGDNYESDWNGNEGWFSLGAELDVTPLPAYQNFIVGTFGGDPTGNSDDASSCASFILDTGEQEFAVVENYYWNDFARSWYDTGTYWYKLVGPSWVGVSEQTVEAALGGVDITVYNQDGWSAYTEVTITGKVDGSPFDFIETAVSDWDWGTDHFDVLTYGANSANFNTFTGQMAQDGLGNAASETFEFDGSGVGEIVIGGFRPNGFFATAEVDRLDFSQLAGVHSAADLIITVEHDGGYFDDVIIDFVDQDYGSVRLVGVGEYFTDHNVNGIANSIIFA